jgi:hypothetical protein
MRPITPKTLFPARQKARHENALAAEDLGDFGKALIST